MATHSSEIISEAEPHELVVINKREREASRLADVSNVQRALDRIGSLHNVTLTHLARTRRVLFAHPDDLRALSLAAARLGRGELAQRADYTVLHVGREISEATAAEALLLLAQTLGKPLLGALLAPLCLGAEQSPKTLFVSRYPGAELISALLTAEVVSTAARAALKRRHRGRAAAVGDEELQACVRQQLEGGAPELSRLNAGLKLALSVTVSLGDLVDAADEGALRRAATPALSLIEQLRAAPLGGPQGPSRVPR
jgi:hypothetical protein